jgi:hypothetical protein
LNPFKLELLMSLFQNQYCAEMGVVMLVAIMDQIVFWDRLNIICGFLRIFNFGQNLFMQAIKYALYLLNRA